MANNLCVLDAAAGAGTGARTGDDACLANPVLSGQEKHHRAEAFSTDEGRADTQPEFMATQSVAAQGLGAMEWLLYDKSADHREERFCQLGEAVSGHLVATSGLLVDAWSQDPWGGAPEKVRKDAYFRVLTNQFDFVMKKLARPLGKPGSPKPTNWRRGDHNPPSKALMPVLKHCKVSTSPVGLVWIPNFGIKGSQNWLTASASTLSCCWQISLNPDPPGECSVRLTDTGSFLGFITNWNTSISRFLMKSPRC